VRKNVIYPYWFTLPAMLFYSIFFVLPIVAGAVLALTNWDLELNRIQFVGLQNFINIFNDPYYHNAVKNTFKFAFTIMIVRNLFAILLAVALTRKLKMRNLLRTLFYLPSVLSYIIVGILFTSLFRSSGMINQFLGTFGINGVDWLGDSSMALVSVMILDIWMWTGFHMMIYIAGIQSISPDFYEASLIDGANAWQQFSKITIPLLTPALRINIIISLIGGFRVFDQVLVLTNGGPGRATTVISLLVYQTFSQGLYGKATAMEMGLSIVIFVMSVFISKFFARREVEM
jgi:raffinose/stachyose/melibiose transport system permease protein